VVTGSRRVKYEGADLELVRHILSSPGRPTDHQ
jgi:hypothetical protein